jgi:tRNA1Val (adenine37-N6)-methyltransferase
MKEINYLFGKKKAKIVQDTQMFKFSLDSMLLPSFVDHKVQYKRVLDIGTGNAPIPIVLSAKTKAKIDAIEIQRDVYELAVESIALNKLENQINLINDDVIDWYKKIETDTYDLILCNPPYFKNSNQNSNEYKTISRHESKLDIEMIMKIAKKILKNKGRIVVVHRANRLIEIINVMKINNIEPKRIQFIYSKKGLEANSILIEGMKNGNPDVKIEEPLYVHNKNGEYTVQIKKMLR